MRIALLNCYFGELPNYFDLWLQSCENNPGIDFYLITDAVLSHEVPANVNVISTTFDELIQRIESKFDFKVNLSTPYKLTDFKPAYGYIFEDLFKPYDYWGYCDIDLIFGNILKFIEKPIKEGYEKIYQLGHLTIYQNTKKMRELFMQKGGMFSYRRVFSDDNLYSYDEHCGQMLKAKVNGVKEYCQEDMADISCRIQRLTASRQKNYPYQVFYYEDGAVYRAFIDNGSLSYQEFIYIHIQKRKYKNIDQLLNGQSFYILSDTFEKKEKNTLSKSDILKRAEYLGQENDQKQLMQFRRQKYRYFLLCSPIKKWIWMKQKIGEKHF